MKLLLSVLLIIFATVSFSQESYSPDFPARYSVSGVNVDDTLNVRELPDSSSTILEELAHNTTGVEVLHLSADNQWGRIAGGDGNGWVSMRYMEAEDMGDPDMIPRPMTCLGTEPFWTITLSPDSTVFEEFGLDFYNLTPLREAVGSYSGYMGTYAGEDGDAYTLLIQERICSDGMTDRDYAFRAMLFTENVQGNGMNSGCCTLDAR